jgi:hypothetical protein
MSHRLRLFLKITQREFIDDYMRFFNLRHSGTVIP